MPGKTIVILGGGVGGIVAANRLRKLLSRDHRVVLIDRTVWHSFAPSFAWVMLGWRKPERISRDLRSLQRKGIEVVIGEITGVDLSARQVTVDDKQSLPFDYLVIAMGADYSAAGVSGLECAWTFYTLEGADRLREELSKFQGGRVVVLVTSLPYKCPAAPYEGALLLDYYFRRKREIRDKVEIQVVTPERQPLPVAGQEVGGQVLEILAGREVRFSPDSRVRSVDAEGKLLRFQDGTETAFDLLIAVPGHRSPHVLEETGLVSDGEWLPVDRETLATQFEGVYAIGDVASIPLANGMMLPKAGVFAHGEAEVVARNIAAEIMGGQQWAFGGEGPCFLETGFGKAGYAAGKFYAEPEPTVMLRRPSILWHWQKQGFERWWLWRWF